jgi:geranylgeranyl diphosphate synthase type II
MYLRKYLESPGKNSPPPRQLQKAMAYSVLAGGKRLRAILAIASYESTGRRSRNIIPVASSIELIHTYSLIHDDLPAMDDDDFRRNKPTSHRVFGEATAILAGDALLTEAFGMLSRISIDPRILLRVIRELACASGAQGMVGGQTADILYEDKRISARQLLYIHTHKTGALIQASVRVGAIMAGASPQVVRSLSRYGENLGLAYQIIDDILDVTGSRKEMGKSAGADVSRGKNTYPALYGLDESQRKAENLIHDALLAITKFDSSAEPLREIAQYILRRQN